MDAVPGLSQIKSIAQFVTGNTKGAKETQKNFVKLCPGVSQVTSAVQAISGDVKSARKTQMEFLKGVSGMVDSVPVVGHAKGAVHYICDDMEGGHKAMKAASHTTGVIGGGVGGFLVGGPVGAVAGGVMGGVAADEIICIGDIVVNGKEAKPYGYIDNIVNIIEDPKDGGKYVDLIGQAILDGTAGYAAGNGIGKKIKYEVDKNRLAEGVGSMDAAIEIIENGESMRELHSEHNIKGNKPHVQTQVKDLSTGKTFVGHNKQIRKVIKKSISPGQTELQKQVPQAKQVLNRPPNTCAEHQAYNEIYRDRPNVLPADTRGNIVEWNRETGQPYTREMCDNCKEYSSAMGDVSTEKIPRTPVPIRVRFSQLAVSTGLGVGARALAEGVGERALAEGVGARALAEGVGARALAEARWSKTWNSSF